jgi:catechol 2,3-dioxygenase-like lactoylglutathione lyase family enzyme
MKFICSLICVEDVSKSRQFYETVLNQVVKYDFGENVWFESGFAIHLRDHFQTLINDNPILTKANNGELYFEEEELQVFQKKLKQFSVEFIHEVKTQPWGQKVLRFYDPDGNIIEVGEPIELDGN